MITTPYKLVNGIILIPVIADGIDGYFAFDTGAMQTAVNKVYFPEMHGEQIDIAKFSEGVKEGAADKGVLTSLCFSDIEKSNLPVLVMDLMYVENVLKTMVPDLKLLGTLGIDVIADYTVMLDYNSSELVLNPQNGFDEQIAFPLNFHKLPIISVTIGDKAYDFVLDTGASTCLLSNSFLDEPQLLTVSDNPRVVTVPVVQVGEKVYRNITAAVSDISAIQKRVPVEGVIGYQILSAQRSILDFKKQQLILENIYQ